MKNPKLSTIVLSIIFCVLTISRAQADISQMIQAGIDYLELSQDETSGLWGTDKETPYRDAAVVVDVLARLEANYTNILTGSINPMYRKSTDYIARKIIASVSANDGVVDPSLVTTLVEMQNTDGGWGYQKHYGSNTIETALAIKALVAASYVIAS